jgi:hypothetical protein
MAKAKAKGRRLCGMYEGQCRLGIGLWVHIPEGPGSGGKDMLASPAFASILSRQLTCRGKP